MLISQASSNQTNQSFSTQTGASAGGGRQGSTWYLLDGVPNMDTVTLLAAPFPNADATQEFRVITNNFDARYGFAPNAVVNIQTKGGSNALHGGLFEFIRNNDLNAANPFSKAVDQLKRNQFGGYAGGPIIKDKLFIFGNYQGTRNRPPPSSSIQAPTLAPIMLTTEFAPLMRTSTACSKCKTAPLLTITPRRSALRSVIPMASRSSRTLPGPRPRMSASPAIRRLNPA